MKVQLDMDTPDGGFVSYVEDNFNMHYAPDVAENCVKVLELDIDKDTRVKVMAVALAARKCIESWTIRDEVDRSDADRGIKAANKALTLCG